VRYDTSALLGSIFGFLRVKGTVFDWDLLFAIIFYDLIAFAYAIFVCTNAGEGVTDDACCDVSPFCPLFDWLWSQSASTAPPTRRRSPSPRCAPSSSVTFSSLSFFSFSLSFFILSFADARQFLLLHRPFLDRGRGIAWG